LRCVKEGSRAHPQEAGPRLLGPRRVDASDQVLDAVLAVLGDSMDAASGQLRALRKQLRSAGAAVTPSRPVGVGAGPHVALGEMFGRSDVRYRDLVRVFSVRNPSVQPRPFASAEVVRAYGPANSRRFLCVLLLMAHQLVRRGEPAQSGLSIRALRAACEGYGVPDAHANLYRDLVARPGLEVQRSPSGHTVRLLPGSHADGGTDLSVAAKEVCALSVRAIAPFVVGR
jgi:hypothetical protein